MRLTKKEMAITMNMWAMKPATIKRIVKKIEAGKDHRFCNGMVYTPKTETLEKK